MIFSEIARLRQVLLHKPVYALGYLTPQNCRHYLFDDVLWVEKANAEHDAFEQVLESFGVEVLLLHTLLQETLENVAARDWLFNARIKQLSLHASLKNTLLSFLNSLSATQATRYLLGGLLVRECQSLNRTLLGQALTEQDFLIPPLPNHLYVRDSSCWIGQGVVISAMKYPVRTAEAINLAAIYKYHPRFRVAGQTIWLDGSQDESLPSIEGGDILVINEKTLLIGISQRTSAAAVELLAQALFKAGVKQQVIAVQLPKARRYMHLDVVLTMVREDTFVSALPDTPSIRAWRLHPGKQVDSLEVEPIDNLYASLAQALGVAKLQLIYPGGDYFAVQREQWSDSTNLLAIASGEVIAYDRNQAMNRKLKAAGLRVHEIQGSELSRGRGGARCMSCPIQRVGG